MSEEREHKTDNEDLYWIQQSKQGNLRAFDQLVVKYQQRLYHVVRNIVLQHDDANDILQDTFVKAFKHLERFDEQLPFYPWLLRIALNTALNQQAKAKRMHLRMISLDQHPAIDSPDPDDAVQHLEQTELQEKITDALAALPVDQRMVFVLRTSEELSYQEISEQLDISLGTVMSRLSRARAKLKTLLKGYFANQNSGAGNDDL
ncbi:MAG: sigma-70 family RNA polymerase sigma factor [candidate division KSB1 bacterium]|nr:sigma-70 family RNA polymerase sigma factor [candidate division KSB1 bacterium]MDZ7342868.1 sigma-70 family RNA polymerase sigma factor [candidate division KSB1 bacterium]